MLLTKNYEKDNLVRLFNLFPNIGKHQLETMVYAFGLLQALSASGLPFCFKGGTSLLLLLKHPKRISTDIDIVVPSKTDIGVHLRRIENRFPFRRSEEHGKKNPYFRHFYFHVDGNLCESDLLVNLDVAFNDNPFIETTEKEIVLPFLLSSGINQSVVVPSPAALLGDKIAVFAPHTLGVNPFATSLGMPHDNRLQVVKQMFDIAQLFDEGPSFSTVRASLQKTIEFENRLRGTGYTMANVLQDGLEAAFSIASGGRFDPRKEYSSVFSFGIFGLSSNVFHGPYYADDAAIDAAKVALLYAGLLKNVDIFNMEELPIFKGSQLRHFKALKSGTAFKMIQQGLGLLDG